MRISTEAFDDGGTMPHDYTADGNNHSPPLKFHEVPAEARSLAVLMEREAENAPSVVHWVVFNLPPLTAGLARAEIAGRYRDGVNAFQRVGYSGPRETTQQSYCFRLFALDSMLDLRNSAPAEEVIAAMQGHIVAEAAVRGRYACRAPLPDRSSPPIGSAGPSATAEAVRL